MLDGNEVCGQFFFRVFLFVALWFLPLSGGFQTSLIVNQIAYLVMTRLYYSSLVCDGSIPK